MTSVTDPEELSLLSKQRTTAGPHNTFDASQFKLQVDQDVPSDVIEKLQEEFGGDMAGGKKLIDGSP